MWSLSRRCSRRCIFYKHHMCYVSMTGDYFRRKNCCKGDWTNRSTLFVFYWYLTLWSLALTTSSHSLSMGPDAWKTLPLELRWHSVKSTFKRHWNPSCSLEPTASLLTFLMTRLLFTLTNFVFIFILSPIFLIADKHWYPTQGAIKIALTDLWNI